MSHFVVMVIGENPEEQLAQYDENLTMPMHIYQTKAQMIERAKANRERFANGPYKQYLEDKEEYKKHCTNERHIEYMENEFPDILKMSDEELYEREKQEYQGYIDDYKKDKMRPPYGFDNEGNLLSTFNEQSKWDWYVLGGRWANQIKLKEGGCADEALKSEIANLDELMCFAYIREYEWYERGQMGWFGHSTDKMTEEQWNEEVQKMLAELPDDELISIYDCHI